MSTPHPIRCRCGQMRGTLAFPNQALRLVCYCRDCQTAAHALGEPERTVDGNGGTAIVASLQSNVTFTQGSDKLACLSLTDKGIYRWYASCCRTPIANTVRRPQMSYVGIVHSCLGESAQQATEAWPEHFNVNPTHAKGPVAKPGLRAFIGTLKIARLVLGARFSGRWRQSPFFRNGSAQTATEVRVLTHAEFERARESV